MNESHLTLTAEQREFLEELLESALKEKRVEEHRTRTPSFREHLIHHEQMITAILTQIRQPVS